MSNFVASSDELPKFTAPMAVPPPPQIPRGMLDRLENQLREAIFARSTASANEITVLRAAFRAIDKDGSGRISVCCMRQ